MDEPKLEELVGKLKEAEQLLQLPSAPGHYDKASKFLTAIARHAPTGTVASAAMKAVSRAYRCRHATGPDAELNAELWRLGKALGESRAFGKKHWKPAARGKP